MPKLIYHNRFVIFLSFLLTLLFYSCENDNDLFLNSQINQDESIRKKINLNFTTENWLFNLSDQTLLKDITLVGSEGSLALAGSNAPERQDEGLEEQLKHGIRMFDFELKTADELGEDDFYVSYNDVPIAMRKWTPAFFNLVAPPHYEEPFRFKKDVLSVLTKFLRTHYHGEFVIIYIHKSSSTDKTSYDRILKKMKKKLALNNYLPDKSFNANTPIRDFANKLLIMEIEDKGSDSYLKHNNERVWRVVNQSLDYITLDWKKRNIKKAIDSAHKESLKDMMFITYTSGWGIPYFSTLTAREVANHTISSTADYIKETLFNPTGYIPDMPYISQRSGFFFTNFSTSENAKKLINACIEQSILVNGKNKQPNVNTLRWVPNP